MDAPHHLCGNVVMVRDANIRVNLTESIHEVAVTRTGRRLDTNIRVSLNQSMNPLGW